MITKPLTFKGGRLEINYSTSAAGGIRVEIQNPDETPIRGFTLAEAHEIFGDQHQRNVSWQAGTDVSQLSGRPVRLRFVVRDADLYSFRFAE